MNWEHLKTFLWLRWRLIANRNKRAGVTSVILQGILMAILLGAGVVAFFGGIALGYLAKGFFLDDSGEENPPALQIPRDS